MTFSYLSSVLALLAELVVVVAKAVVAVATLVFLVDVVVAAGGGDRRDPTECGLICIGIVFRRSSSF